MSREQRTCVLAKNGETEELVERVELCKQLHGAMYEADRLRAIAEVLDAALYAGNADVIRHAQVVAADLAARLGRLSTLFCDADEYLRIEWELPRHGDLTDVLAKLPSAPVVAHKIVRRSKSKQSAVIQ